MENNQAGTSDAGPENCTVTQDCAPSEQCGMRVSCAPAAQQTHISSTAHV